MTYYKILRKDLLHNGFQYALGLNIDHLPFSTSEMCSPGGLYFCKLDDLHLYFHFGELVGEIELPADARVHHEPLKSKADKLILKGITPKGEFFVKHVDEISDFFKFVPTRMKTPEMCLTAVNHNPMNFYFVPKELRTPDICALAVKVNPSLICYVPHELRTLDMCTAVLIQNPSLLQHVPDKLKTPEMCLTAVRHSPFNIAVVPLSLLTAQMCAEAIEQNPCVIEYIPDEFKTPEMCQRAIDWDPRLEQYV
jgi:hypothetical protein